VRPIDCVLIWPEHRRDPRLRSPHLDGARRSAAHTSRTRRAGTGPTGSHATKDQTKLLLALPPPPCRPLIAQSRLDHGHRKHGRRSVCNRAVLPVLARRVGELADLPVTRYATCSPVSTAWSPIRSRHRETMIIRSPTPCARARRRARGHVRPRGGWPGRSARRDRQGSGCHFGLRSIPATRGSTYQDLMIGGRRTVPARAWWGVRCVAPPGIAGSR
jgi:hypothetical protein